jgi:hypothetical protein
MPAQTPRGNRYEYISMSCVIEGKVSPSCSDVIEQACSTTSVEGMRIKY